MPDFDAADDHISFVCCDHCGQHLPLMLAVIVEKTANRKHLRFVFCTEECANEFYLERLRKEGL